MTSLELSRLKEWLSQEIHRRFFRLYFLSVQLRRNPDVYCGLRQVTPENLAHIEQHLPRDVDMAILHAMPDSEKILCAGTLEAVQKFVIELFFHQSTMYEALSDLHLALRNPDSSTWTFAQRWYMTLSDISVSTYKPLVIKAMAMFFTLKFWTIRENPAGRVPVESSIYPSLSHVRDPTVIVYQRLACRLACRDRSIRRLATTIKRAAWFDGLIDSLASPIRLQNSPDECVICTGVYFPFDGSKDSQWHERAMSHYPVRIRTCGHVFGRSCLNFWFKQRMTLTCPMCRAILPKDELDVPKALYDHLHGPTATRTVQEIGKHLRWDGVDLLRYAIPLLDTMNLDLILEDIFDGLHGEQVRGHLDRALKDHRRQLHRAMVTWGFRDMRTWCSMRDEWIGTRDMLPLRRKGGRFADLNLSMRSLHGHACDDDDDEEDNDYRENDCDKEFKVFEALAR